MIFVFASSTDFSQNAKRCIAQGGKGKGPHITLIRHLQC